MTGDEILAAIDEVAQEHLDLEVSLQRDQRLVDDLELDSLKALTLAVEVENRFRIRLDPEIEAELQTVGDLVDAVERQLDE